MMTAEARASVRGAFGSTYQVVRETGAFDEELLSRKVANSDLVAVRRLLKRGESDEEIARTIRMKRYRYHPRTGELTKTLQKLIAKVKDEIERGERPDDGGAAGHSGDSTSSRTIWIAGPVRNWNRPRTALKTQKDTRSGFDIYGHLIADRFGGPGDQMSGNLVPMHDVINQSGGPYYAMEQEISRLLSAACPCLQGDPTRCDTFCKAHMFVKCEYRDDTVRPYCFYVEFRLRGRAACRKSWCHYNFNDRIRPPDGTEGP